MQLLKSGLFMLFLGFLQPVTADINAHFTAIQSDPNALYAFLKAMPKGGELHYHLAGGAFPETMLSLAAHGPYCINNTTFMITKTKAHCDGLPSENLAKNTAIYEQTVRAWSMKQFTPNDESGHDHFYASFFKFMPVAADFYPELLSSVMRRAATQHELYLEVMVLPDNAHASTFSNKIKNITSAKNKQRVLLTDPDFRTNITSTIHESKRILDQARQLLGCGTNTANAACGLTVKFQYYVLREQSLDQVFAQALNGFAAAAQSSDIVGVNLVQAEDGPLSLRDYREQMRIFEQLHALYPTVHIALHAGELTPQENLSSEHLRFHIHDALFTGHAERIGHGADIIHEKNATDLAKYMAKAEIPVEINLTSNHAILTLAGKNHPLPFYLAHHVPVVLSTDDEGILRTNLTQQYVDTVRNYHLDYASIKSINRNALTYSFLPGRSLWANTHRHIAVPACLDLMSSRCALYIKENQKAKLEWQLEQDLNRFEKNTIS